MCNPFLKEWMVDFSEISTSYSKKDYEVKILKKYYLQSLNIESLASVVICLLHLTLTSSLQRCHIFRVFMEQGNLFSEIKGCTYIIRSFGSY